jgi:hypothetical protein
MHHLIDIDDMNPEEELYRLPSTLDPLEALLQEEDDEWSDPEDTASD